MTTPEKSSEHAQVPDDFVFPDPKDYERERAEAAEAKVRELEKLLRDQKG